MSLVSARLTNPISPSSSPVPFDKVPVNIGDMWDPNTHKFTMKAEQGIFYVAMNAGVLDGKALDFVLQKSDHPFASCSHTYTVTGDGDETSRDIILKLRLSDTLHFTSSTGLYSEEESGKGTYTNMAIFNIVELMSSDQDPVAFSVARDSSLSESADPVAFNQILFNDYSNFDVSTNKFTAPSSGIYFFSFSVGVAAQSPAEIMLYLNDLPFTNIIRESTAHTGTDVIGRSCMMYLNESDTVHVVNKENKVARSSDLLETSFAGFKYERLSGNQVRNKIICNVLK